MDPLLKEAIKYGAGLVLPPDIFAQIFGGDVQYQIPNDNGDGPNPKRTAALEEVKRKDGSISLWIGTRETGKTVGAHREAEYFGRPTYTVSPEERPPSWITLVRLSEIDKLPPRITLILDDLPAYMSNRDYNNQLVQAMERIVPMCRHKRKWHIIFNTQSTAQADKYILDCELAFFKPLGILMDDAERPNIRRIYRQLVNPYFENRTEDFIRKHAYMKSRTYVGGIGIKKPTDPGRPKEMVLLAEPNAQGTWEVTGKEEVDEDEK
jgi:hypothetical protein